MDDDNEYEVDDSDDGQKPDSEETEEEASETVVESGDITAVSAEHASAVTFGTSTSPGAACFVSVKFIPFVFIHFPTCFTTSAVDYHFQTCTVNLVRIHQ